MINFGWLTWKILPITFILLASIWIWFLLAWSFLDSNKKVCAFTSIHLKWSFCESQNIYILYIFIYIKWFYIKEIKTGTGTRSLLQICIWPRDARENFYKTFYSNYILPFDGWHAENIYIPNWYSICTMYCTLYMID